MNRFLVFIHIPDKACNTFRLMIGNLLRLLPAHILKNNCQLRIQICGFMQTAFYLVLLEPCPVKNGIIRQETDGCTGFLCLSDYRKQSVFQLCNWISPLIFILIDKSPCLYGYGQMGRQGVDNRGTDSVQTAACLIGGIIKFSSGVQSSKNQPFRANPLFVHSHRDTTPVV